MLSDMPKRLNIQALDISYDETDPEGFRSGGARLGPLLGATRTGASVYELPPGQSICPYHYEYGEEEWLLVLSGPSPKQTTSPARSSPVPAGVRTVGVPVKTSTHSSSPYS